MSPQPPPRSRRSSGRRACGASMIGQPTALPDDALIDALYGLEPVFEPDRRGEQPSGSEGAQLHSVQCPYCGESFETLIDLSAGSTSYIEDCQICCRPIEFQLEVDEGGALQTLRVQRSD